ASSPSASACVTATGGCATSSTPSCRISGPAAITARSISGGSRSSPTCPSRTGPRAESLSYSFDLSVLWRYRDQLLDRIRLTLALSIVSLAGALGIGVLAGAAGESERRWVWGLASSYVEVARNVPLLVHLYVWYLGLSALRLPAFWCGVLGLSLYSGAYVAE